MKTIEIRNIHWTMSATVCTAEQLQDINRQSERYIRQSLEYKGNHYNEEEKALYMIFFDWSRETNGQAEVYAVKVES